ncbi:Amino acid adenylation domain-containing protein [Sulfidibacter corallicola]|uniref:Amino acid adenylation domain-containing protein n=1 Tax=Sulfidibacter corallicola TaxID=2818388 RepID=A0A8A4TK13_SULCO|nr:non-ribosomal peptide synthetase [Sulfidibacter corallicola]QTD50359.1 amino acid adenylation domain-containing protein [Sulfidibacter corallicola]
MDIEAFLLELTERDIKLWREGANLRYDAPEGVMDEDTRARIVANKSHILDYLRSGSATDPIELADRGRPLPLSFPQERLWFLDQMTPQNTAYLLQAGLLLDGHLDYGLLRRTLSALIERHEILRTSFPAEDGKPVMRISERTEPVVEKADWSHQPGEIQLALLNELATDQARTPFDLASLPLMRIHLVRFGPTNHALLITMHHMITDGWSTGVFTRDFSRYYEAFCQDLKPRMPPLPIQFADYACWQRRKLARTQHLHLAFWCQHLEGAAPVLELPCDRPRTARVQFHGRAESFSLPPLLTRRLSRLAESCEASLFMVLLATFATLLMRLCRTEDLVIGVPVANREREELEHLIGFFVNTLPLRLRAGTGTPFRDLVAQVREVTLDGFDHAQVPFEKVVEAVQPRRDLSHNPLFQVMFALQNTRRERLQMPGLTVRPLDLDTITSKLDLSLVMWPESNGEELHGLFEYNTELFDQVTIRRWMGHFQILLQAAVNGPDRALTDLALIDTRERKMLLDAGRPSVSTDSPGGCPHRRFEIQAARYPDAVALMRGPREISYGMLNRSANRVAHVLRSLGVTPETTVGLFMERTTSFPAALLGILKAGGVYVPLNPDYPPARLAWMMSDARIGVMVTESHLAERLPHHHARLVCLDQLDDPGEPGATAGTDDRNLMSAPHPENAAYIIYTSGSTGKPKGVVGTHASLMRHLEARNRLDRMHRGDRMLQMSSLSFDMSLEQVTAPLLVGATCVLPELQRWDPEAFAGELEARRITHLILPPALLQQWLDSWLEHPERPPLAHLRMVQSGGEAMPPELLELWADSPLKHHARLVNGYGPTEATICATAFEVPETWFETAPPSRIPIGGVLGARSIHVLDVRGNMLPTGVPGELCIGGPLLARGYLNQPRLTADRFRPDPFGGRPGERLYRTGDLVRFHPDSEGHPGALEFHGRLDHQVKVRGYRVECGEIEAVLIEHPAVHAAAVVTRADATGQNALIAFVVTETHTNELRAFLAAQLPNYMIPAHFVLRGQLPLTASGKTDRAALERVDAENTYIEDGSTRGYQPPCTPTEELLATTWSDVLQIGAISRDAHFFDLGGHSLLATRVVSRVRASFQVDMPVRRLFELPVLADLARHIDSQRRKPHQRLPPIERRDRSLPLPLSFAQERLWFLDQLMPNHAFYNMPAAATLTGELDTASLTRAFNELIRRHESLRTHFPAVDGRATQVVAETWELELAVHDLENLTEDCWRPSMLRLLDEAFEEPFDLSGGPLLRCGLIRMGPRTNVLYFVLHHIVSDGWSMGIFLDELTRLYQAFHGGKPSPLPELTTQYGDFTVWQRAHLHVEPLLAYWRRHLADAPPLRLPTDFPRPPMPSFRGGRVRHGLDASQAAGLRAIAGACNASLFMVLLSGFSALLARYSRQEDILVGSPIANRNYREIEGLIGFFVNTLALRCDLSGNPSFRDLVLRVRETALEAYAHQDLPFERLVDAMVPERDMSRNPLTQVTMALQNAPRARQQIMAGLHQEALDLAPKNVRFDLELHIWEVEDHLLCDFYYSRDLFEEETIDAMARYFTNLLASAIASPDTPLDRLSLVNANQERTLIAAAGLTAKPFSQSRCLHHLFEDCVARHPERIALLDEAREINYLDLDVAANRLAHLLRGRGVTTETRVGLCLQRSPEMVTAMLAVLKAGGVYVPLQPDYPDARLRTMVADSRPVVMLCDTTSREAAAVAASTIKCPVIVLDDERHLRALRSQPTVAPPCRAAPEAAAYTIYTSGSTGRPKGVVITHEALVNHMQWMQGRFPLTPDDRVLQKTPFFFDASVWEFYAPLLAGSTLVLAAPDGHRDPAYLVDLIDRAQVTVLQLVPSLLRLLLQETDLGTCASLRRVFCGGEALTPDVQTAFYGVCSATLINLYGPTECCIDATAWVCRADRPPLIGTPIDNTAAWILDDRMQPVPPGIPGELYLAGAGLARGYHGQAGMTAARFVPHPFSNHRGARLYRTGDRVRVRPSAGAAGPLEFLGRVDHQVKIRGHRIETGEIEAELANHEAVADVSVVAREILPGESRLVSYVVPDFASWDQGSEGAEQLSRWEEVFQNNYSTTSRGSTGDGSQSELQQDPRFNTVGWNSSYTGDPIAAEEMTEWVERTVERLKRFRAQRILEIGCGSGLLVSRLAPACSVYVATDFSRGALDHLETVRADHPELGHVQTRLQPADCFDGLDPDSFDLVILNSVIQYFPNIDYLMRVMEGAARVLRTGGAIFAGDVRDLGLLEAFHASVELFKAQPTDTLAQLKYRIQQAMLQEEELLVDPAWFFLLRDRIGRLDHTQVLLKRGRFHNEMSLFRYDVVLHAGIRPVPAGALSITELEPSSDGPTLARELTHRQADLVRVRGLRNSRVSTALAAVALMRDLDEKTTAAALRDQLADLPARGFDPERIWTLSEEHTAKLSIAGRSGPGRFNVMFRRAHAPARPIAWDTPVLDPRRPWRSYANDPLQNKFSRKLVPRLRSFLERRLPDHMIPAAFVMLTDMPLLPNGKINRAALPVPERVRPDQVDFVAPRDRHERLLASIWSEVLGLSKVGVHDNFFELGGDSILSIQIVSRANQAGLRLSPRDLFQNQTVADLAMVAGTDEPCHADQGPITGSVPLTPIMHRFLSQAPPTLAHFNQSLLLQVPPDFDPLAFTETLRLLIHHHDALRLRMVREDSGPRLEHGPAEQQPILTRHDLSAMAPEARLQELSRHCSFMQRECDPIQGPLLRASHFDFGGDLPGRLFLVAHHLGVDAVTWRILMEDAGKVYRAIKTNGPISLPPKTTSFQHWSRTVAAHANEPSAFPSAELAHWHDLVERNPTALPTDYPVTDRNNRFGDRLTLYTALDEATTRSLIQDVPRAYNTRINDVLLSALLQTVAAWTGRAELWVELEGHGREDLFPGVDLSRTAGWFTTQFPVFLDHPGAGESLDRAERQGDLLKSVKEQLRAIPRNGFGFGLLRELRGDARLRALQIPEIGFNYLGRFEPTDGESPFVPAPEWVGPDQDPAMGCDHLIDLHIVTNNRELHVNWHYGRHLFRRDTIARLADDFLASLRAITAHCTSPESGGFTPSDFPQADLDMAELDEILDELEE